MHLSGSTMVVPIIGMSPGNSYFKDEEIKFLLTSMVDKFGQTAVLVADTPAIATYVAYGYPQNKARNKAIPKGNNLKNRTRRIATECNLDSRVRIVEWDSEVEDDPRYREAFESITRLQRDNADFAHSVHETTRAVLEHSDRTIENMDNATEIASHYLLSELAFLEFAPQLFQCDQAVYVYHKNWPVYEKYLSGAFDNKPKPHLEFLLQENPYETFMTLIESDHAESQHAIEGKQLDVLERIEKTGLIRASYQNYAPAFMRDEATGQCSGIFNEILQHLAKQKDWQMLFTEETGYGVIVEGLESERFDVFASTVWPTPERVESACFSIPVSYSPVYMWAAARSSVVQNMPYSQLLTSPSLRIAVKQNDISHSIAREDFPFAKLRYVPQLSDPVEVLVAVAQGFADVTFAEPALVHELTKRTGLVLEPVDTVRPIRCYPNCFMLRRNEHRLKQLLDQAIASYLETPESAHLVRGTAIDLTVSVAV